MFNKYNETENIKAVKDYFDEKLEDYGLLKFLAEKNKNKLIENMDN